DFEGTRRCHLGASAPSESLSRITAIATPSSPSYAPFLDGTARGEANPLDLRGGGHDTPPRPTSSSAPGANLRGSELQLAVT
ncbi:MAG: hypothetical protein KDD47_21880, partial [Acidobacteria bacterium]|nr:hypothetical protein [Acidobacteriota bacterium]